MRTTGEGSSVWLDVPSGRNNITDPQLYPGSEVDTAGALAGSHSKDLRKCAELPDNIEWPCCCTIARMQGLCTGRAEILASNTDASHKVVGLIMHLLYTAR